MTDTTKGLREALEPCPFCGQALIKNGPFSRRNADCYIHPQDVNGIDFGRCPAAGFRLYSDDAERIKLWNSRAVLALAPPPVRGEGEVTFEAASAYCDTSTDPLATMLRDAWTRLQGDKPDVAGAEVAIHGARLGQAYRALGSAPPIPPGVGEAREALEACKAQFEDYARQHRAKGTPEADAKAVVNDGMATRCDQALAALTVPVGEKDHSVSQTSPSSPVEATREGWRLVPAEPTEAVLEALRLAEDVLSRAPFSTEIWPNGMHPNTGIETIRAAIANVEGRS